jgi:hypothetical protein
MLSRILLGAVSVLAGGILVSAADAAGSDGDPSATAAASVPLPELTVAPPTDYPDVRILNRGLGQAAFNPADPKRLVVAIVDGTACYVKASADGGKTWGALVQLPQLAGAECWYDPPPAVTYAARGGRLYAAYPYQKRSPSLSGITFSVSTDQGATWSGPTSVLPEGHTGDDDGFVDVRLAAAPDGPYVYVVAEWAGWHSDRTLFFTSSGDQGSSWTPGKQIARSDPEIGINLWGFALAAGRDGNVFVAYGWDEELSDGHDYTLRVARSADRGASFVYGVADQSDGLYSRLSNPDIEIGPLGTAHLVYAKEDYPTSKAILYKYSYAPYSRWSGEPVRLDDVPYVGLTTPRLAVGACGRASVLHATWVEYLSDNGPSNVLYTRRIAQRGYTWSDPLKVGKLNNIIFENGLAALGAKAFSVFSGRTSPKKWGMFGSRISSGVTCP